MIVSPSYSRATAVTKSDTVNVTPPAASQLTNPCFDALWVGGAGDVVLVQEDGTTLTFTCTTVPAIIPVRGKRVNSASTTATKMVALYL